MVHAAFSAFYSCAIWGATTVVADAAFSAFYSCAISGATTGGPTLGAGPHYGVM